jgi:hypothetical protein
MFCWLAVLMVISAPLLRAQSRESTLPEPSTSDTSSQGERWPKRGWISGGLGVGTWPYGSIAGVASGWYSIGEAAMGVRFGGANALFSEQRSDKAFLIGARTRGNRGFVLGAVGISKVASSRSCDCSGGLTRPAAMTMGYSLEAHGQLELAGVGVVVFGALGPTSVRYNAFAVTLNAGWFGP